VHDSKWQKKLRLLQEYVQDHGQLPSKESGVPLASWCSIQRQQYSKGKLSGERQQALEKLPGWCWKVSGQRSMATLSDGT
jgi:hypothetical protein